MGQTSGGSSHARTRLSPCVTVLSRYVTVLSPDVTVLSPDVTRMFLSLTGLWSSGGGGWDERVAVRVTRGHVAHLGRGFARVLGHPLDHAHHLGLLHGTTREQL